MSGPEPGDEPRRLTLLYQLFLTSQASRGLVKLALAGSGMTGEEYALYSYLFANGPRTLSQGASDLGMPITTLATLLQQPVARGEVLRRPHPEDGRARLLSLTDAGTSRLQAAMPAFTRGYRAVLAELEASGADVEAIFAALAELRGATDRAMAGMSESAQPGSDAG